MRSFVKPIDAPAVAESAGPPTAAAAPESATPSATQSTVAIGRPRSVSAYVDGEVTATDLKMPFLACVQAVGPKSVLHTPGTLLLGETAVTTAPKPQEPTPRLRVLFCKCSKSYVENLPYNPTPGGKRPNIFYRKDEVDAVGGTLEWRGNVGPTYIPKLVSLALVRSPKDFEDASFNIIDGTGENPETYAPAMISFQKTSYGAAKTLLTDLSLSLANDPTKTFYDLFWVREQKGQNWVWVAKLVRVRDEKPSDTLRAMAIKVAGAQVETVEDDE